MDPPDKSYVPNSLEDTCNRMTAKGHTLHFEKDGIAYCGLVRNLERFFLGYIKCPYRIKQSNIVGIPQMPEEVYCCLKYQKKQ